MRRGSGIAPPKLNHHQGEAGGIVEAHSTAGVCQALGEWSSLNLLRVPKGRVYCRAPFGLHDRTEQYCQNQNGGHLQVHHIVMYLGSAEIRSHTVRSQVSEGGMLGEGTTAKNIRRTLNYELNV